MSEAKEGRNKVAMRQYEFQIKSHNPRPITYHPSHLNPLYQMLFLLQSLIILHEECMYHLIFPK